MKDAPHARQPAVPGAGDALTARLIRHRAKPLIRLRENAGHRWLVVVAAGREPASIALTNVAYELARHPEHEADDAFVDEVLRLRPSASAVLRRLTLDVEIAGHTVPFGATVALPLPLLHREPTAFPERTRSSRAVRPTDDRSSRSATGRGGASAERSPAPNCARRSRGFRG